MGGDITGGEGDAASAMGRRGRKLRPGDRVRIVAPAGPPTREGVERGVELLRGWGLVGELGAHVFDRHGHFLAGTDGARAADLNDAFADPAVGAIWAATGGKGSHRLVPRLDIDAAAADPKPLIGFSDITSLHLALWRRCRLAGLHAPMADWDHQWMGPTAAERLRGVLMSPEPVTIRRDPAEPTAQLSMSGRAAGVLLGGNLAAIGGSVGWNCPPFDGAILLLETPDPTRLGGADMVLTQLRQAGLLAGLRGVALGQLTGFTAPDTGRWSMLDVLAEHLCGLGIPVLGGLPIGHGPHAQTVPLGVPAVLDADTGTLTVQPAMS